MKNQDCGFACNHRAGNVPAILLAAVVLALAIVSIGAGLARHHSAQAARYLPPGQPFAAASVASR